MIGQWMAVFVVGSILEGDIKSQLDKASLLNDEIRSKPKILWYTCNQMVGEYSQLFALVKEERLAKVNVSDWTRTILDHMQELNDLNSRFDIENKGLATASNRLRELAAELTVLKTQAHACRLARAPVQVVLEATDAKIDEQERALAENERRVSLDGLLVNTKRASSQARKMYHERRFTEAKDENQVADALCELLQVAICATQISTKLAEIEERAIDPRRYKALQMELERALAEETQALDVEYARSATTQMAIAIANANDVLNEYDESLAELSDESMRVASEVMGAIERLVTVAGAAVEPYGQHCLDLIEERTSLTHDLLALTRWMRRARELIHDTVGAANFLDQKTQAVQKRLGEFERSRTEWVNAQRWICLRSSKTRVEEKYSAIARKLAETRKLASVDEAHTHLKSVNKLLGAAAKDFKAYGNLYTALDSVETRIRQVCAQLISRDWRDDFDMAHSFVGEIEDLVRRAQGKRLYDEAHSILEEAWRRVDAFRSDFMLRRAGMSKTEITTGGITNQGGQVFIGNNTRVVANLNSSGQSELATALTSLTEKILASSQIPEAQKKEQIEIINKIGEEAVKPEPNRSFLKMLVDGLTAALGTIPDMAKLLGALSAILSLGK